MPWIAWRRGQQGDGDDEGDNERSDLGNIDMQTERALYRQKRAAQLGRLLAARLELQRILGSETFGAQWKRYVATESGQAAIRTALGAIKNRHIGTSILE